MATVLTLLLLHLETKTRLMFHSWFVLNKSAVQCQRRMYRIYMKTFFLQYLLLATNAGLTFPWLYLGNSKQYVKIADSVLNI